MSTPVTTPRLMGAEVKRKEDPRLIKGAGAMPAIDGGKLEIVQEEPLKRELTDFITAVRDKRQPGVTGADGLRAINLAQRVTDEIDRSLAQ